MPNLPIVTDITLDSEIVLIENGCFSRIKVSDFLKIYTGGSLNICEAVEACNEGIGTWGDFTEPETNLPTMEDIYVSLSNRQGTYTFTSQQFLDNYYDADNDVWSKIILTSGDFTGVTCNGQPVYVGLVINANQISEFKYDTKNIDSSYGQLIGFKLYNDKNEEAI